MMEERCVRRREWLTRERFLDLLGAASLLPGPSSTEVAIYLGEIRGGAAGLVVAGACFILPAAVLVLALAWAYMKYGAMPQVAGLLFGIKPVVVALIAQAVWNLGRTALKSVWLSVLAAAAIGLAVWGASPLVVLIGAGVLWVLIREGTRLARDKAVTAGLWGTGAAGTSAAIGVLPVFLYFLKVGAVLVGSGYVLLAVLRGSGGEDALAERCAVVGCHCREPSDARAVFYGGDLHRVSAGRMERCGTGNRRDVLAGVCVRGSDGKTLAEAAVVGGGERVSGWSECSGGGIDGGGGVAVCACGNREHAGNCVDGFRGGAGVPVQSEFRVVGVGGSDCWDCAARDRLGLSARTKGQLRVRRFIGGPPQRPL
jgi:chromate transport protein ChrA